MSDFEKCRRLKRMGQALADLLSDLAFRPYELDYWRASGLSECETCGLPYFDHPRFRNDLVITCKGDLVKL